MSLNELCVIGHPSRLGGADTELDHQMRCWQAMGLTVHVCHTGALDDNLRAMRLVERGCVYHEQLDRKSLAGLHCISFCNGVFLSDLPEIKKYAGGITIELYPYVDDPDAAGADGKGEDFADCGDNLSH